MMVIFLHATFAITAMLGADWTHGLAGVADVEDGVVIVLVVPPGRGVTNLGGRSEGNRKD